eukprot:TRINITY_DN438_c0_g1_i3.p1 TRINITY_DN438_c0_g1~~TRINITY_DN438_c0_g1_i3.p1  ORF type:complete len:289 (-),score=26.88 TRINITY_DN438_c0_g1_i3:79-945(-)
MQITLVNTTPLTCIFALLPSFSHRTDSFKMHYRTHLVIYCIFSVLICAAAQDDDYDIPCPNNCSSRGSCGLHGVCSCFEGWTGADCATESLLVSNGQIITSNVEENGEIATFHTFLTHLTAHLVIDIQRTSDVRAPLDVFISSRGRPSEAQWNVRARMEADEDFVELVIKNGRNGEWFCGIAFVSNENSTRVVGFSIAMNATNALDSSLASPETPSTGTNPVTSDQPSTASTPGSTDFALDTNTVAIVAGVLCSVIILILVGGIVSILLLRTKMERMYSKLNEQAGMR